MLILETCRTATSGPHTPLWPNRTWRVCSGRGELRDIERADKRLATLYTTACDNRASLFPPKQLSVLILTMASTTPSTLRWGIIATGGISTRFSEVGRWGLRMFADVRTSLLTQAPATCRTSPTRSPQSGRAASLALRSSSTSSRHPRVSVLGVSRTACSMTPSLVARMMTCLLMQ